MAEALSQCQVLKELKQRIAVLKQFDKSMEDTGKSLEDARDDIVQSIESLVQWAQSESTVLRARNPSLCGEEHAICNDDQDSSRALEYLAASLGFAPLDPSIRLTESDGISTLASSKHDSQDAKLMKVEAAARSVQDADQKVCLANLDGDEASASDPYDSAINYWMKLVAILASDSEEKDNDESGNSSEPSFLDSSQNERILLDYMDAYDRLIQKQQQSLQQHWELEGKLKKDVHFLDNVIAHLEAENQGLVEEIERKRLQGKKSAAKKIKVLCSELNRSCQGMQNDSAAARACLRTANISATAEDTPAEHSDMMANQEPCGDAILQGYGSLVDNVMKDQNKLGLKRDRLETRAARAEVLVTSAEKSFHEKDPIAGSLELVEAIKNLRMWEKALPLVQGTVGGRTFAEWLPDILQIIEKPL